LTEAPLRTESPAGRRRIERVAVENTAQAYLELLRARGIRYFFGNAGTDFGSLIDGLARFAAEGKAWPRPITAPHETVAVAMAHGVTMVTGAPQAIMVHVTVGTANAAAGLINAARMRIPMLFTAGRNPVTEAGVRGARSRYIHWAQEAYDQAGMVREYVKWDYELRTFAQLETVVDRALQVALTPPAGPVYLTLPRELLAEPHAEIAFTVPARLRPARPAPPDPAAIREAARILARAERPLIITAAAGRDPAAVPALVGLAEAGAIPVVAFNPTYLSFPSTHPLHLGFEPGPALRRADVVLVVESDVPWIPKDEAPAAGATVIQLGEDPAFVRYPIRGFPADLALGGHVAAGLTGLAAEVGRLARGRAAVGRRRAWAATEQRRLRRLARAAARRGRREAPVDFEWLSACLNAVADGRTMFVNEYDLRLAQVDLARPGSYFASPPSSGLGWGLGAALGAKLAAPEQTVICTVGDGAYLFGAPSAAHFVSRAEGLPVLFVIFDNQCWNAVKRATRELHPDGWAVRTGHFPLSDLSPAPAYAQIVRAFGGYGEQVEKPAEVPAALERALRAVRREGRQALLHVLCRPS
jgi:acetolactate synthase-1/2/3 large subunit